MFGEQKTGVRTAAVPKESRTDTRPQIIPKTASKSAIYMKLSTMIKLNKRKGGK